MITSSTHLPHFMITSSTRLLDFIINYLFITFYDHIFNTFATFSSPLPQVWKALFIAGHPLCVPMALELAQFSARCVCV